MAIPSHALLVPLTPLELFLPRGPRLRGLRLGGLRLVLLRLVLLRLRGPKLSPLRLVTLSSSRLVLRSLRGPRLAPLSPPLLVPHLTRGPRLVPLREARQSPTTSPTLFTA